ncbi:cysteine proteinase inhibitor 5-like [Andrographis paniculata]|uniref:cysteine proteinase inhibitor 5-like n=1 Tax=Andrographis paniculata TaxID=175694 RepID=UPI0021E8300F|nr:cysteine proteinase inhibitor 5-like [Andrographis paniculata]
MERKSLPLLALAALLVVAVPYSAADGWIPIGDLKDPVVVGAGKFAVEQHNQWTLSNMTFAAVLNGEKQDVQEGTIFNLGIAVADGPAFKKFNVRLKYNPAPGALFEYRLLLWEQGF